MDVYIDAICVKFCAISILFLEKNLKRITLTGEGYAPVIVITSTDEHAAARHWKSNPLKGSEHVPVCGARPSTGA
jgi:hypothetical protein